MDRNREKNGEDYIDLGAVLAVLLDHLAVILAVGVLVGAAAFAYTYFLVTPLYTSVTKAYILTKSAENVTQSDLNVSSDLASDYAELVTSRPVVEAAIDELGLSGETYTSLCGKISVDTSTSERILKISVTDPNPEQARQIADSICANVADQMEVVMNIEAVNVFEEANLPTSPSSPNVRKNTAIGFLLGVMLVVAVVVIRFLMNDRIHNAYDVEQYLELSMLGVVSVMEEEKGKKKRFRRKKKEGK